MNVNPIRLLWVFTLAMLLAVLPAIAADPPITAPVPAAESLVTPAPAAGTAPAAVPASPAAALEPPRTSAGGTNTAPGNLPRNLSAWNMFRSADHIVKEVIIGLLLALVLTWTVALAKFVELWLLKRKLLPALGGWRERGR